MTKELASGFPLEIFVAPRKCREVRWLQSPDMEVDNRDFADCLIALWCSFDCIIVVALCECAS